jgi:hypothetical protein
MSKWSSEFQALWSRPNRTLKMDEYEFCLSEFTRKHEKRSIFQWVLAIGFFGVGLWLLVANVVFGSVFFIALAAYCNLNSTNHALLSEILNANRLQAMLIHKQTEELEAIRKECNRQQQQSETV